MALFESQICCPLPNFKKEQIKGKLSSAHRPRDRNNGTIIQGRKLDSKINIKLYLLFSLVVSYFLMSNVTNCPGAIP